ncbi:MAG TPA: FAD-binding oxidoreductase [Ginsengibacter sp.]|nr:FAD-binding oxidoreductase [Ginsengibacter sp.]HRP44173.1 FAD-binding oxidoreductase [Ginsengibacter sp.]
MVSYWEQKSFLYHRHLIICGAGFTGLSAAVYYKREHPASSVLVLEKDAICGGASTQNAGFACFGSVSELLADLTHSDEKKVFDLVEKRFRGLLNLRSLLGDDAIGYEPLHGFELFRQGDQLYEHCLDQMGYLNDKLESITGERVYKPADEKISEFGFDNVVHLIENTAEGQVDTGKMYKSLLELARATGVEILNGISVAGFEEGGHVKVFTDRGSITADKFLIANNGFASTILEGSRTTPARAQALVTAPIEGLKVKGSFHILEGFYYFRNIDDRILLGGGRHLDFEAETTTDRQLNMKIQDDLDRVLREIILPGQQYEVAQRWTGIMGMGNEKQVIAEQLSGRVFCAIRLSGMGLALSTLLGKEVVEMMH